MIEIHNLNKSFNHHKVLDNLNMNIKDGSIYGFVGPNGAGKTTTMRIIAGLLDADSGEILINGRRLGRQNKELIGYMPDFFGVYDKLKVEEYMYFFESFYGRKHTAATEKKIDQLLDCVHLLAYKKTYVDTLSRGMKQKLCLARALIHDPKLLILDEPASGLDPRARQEFRDIIRKLEEEKRTILISSHILSELAEMCTDIGIIHEGRLFYEGTVDDLERHIVFTSPLIIRTNHHMDAAIALLRAHPLVESLTYKLNEVRVVFKGNIEEECELLKQMIAADIPVYSFKREKSSLEAVFMQMTDPEEKHD